MGEPWLMKTLGIMVRFCARLRLPATPNYSA
jgi:hypothetical protein